MKTEQLNELFIRTSIIFICAAMSATQVFSQAWTTLPDVPVKLAFPVVVELNGNVHVMGGGGPDGATTLHLRYQIDKNKWDTLAPIPYKAQQPGGAVAGGEIHYFGGGYPNSGTRLKDHYAYNPGTNTWRKMADVPIPRVIHKTAVLGDSIFVMSGQPDKSRVDVFVKSDSTWHTLGNLPDGNFWYGGIATHHNSIYRFGGGGSTSASAAAHLYNRKSDSWTALMSLSQTNHAPAAATLGDSIYIMGGYSNFRYAAQSSVYDVNTQSYGKGPSLPDGRSYHSAVTVGRCIYSVGGHNDADNLGTSFLRHCLGDPFTNVSTRKVEKLPISVQIGLEGSVFMSAENIGQTVKVTLFNALGQIVDQRVMNAENGHLKITYTHLTPGMYVGLIEGNGSLTSFQLPIGF